MFGLATHHHKYCDKHYPQKSATILDLKKRIRELEGENNSLRQELAFIKRHMAKGDLRAYRKVTKWLKQEDIEKLLPKNTG